MLKAQEVRIGIFVLEDGDIVQVDAALLYWLINQNHERPSTFSQLSPIPLTPEILEKAGFEKADTKQNDNIEFTAYNSKAVDKDIFSIRTDRMKELQRVLVVPVFKNIALPMHLNTVHQLQNLYFDLTGNELEINL